MKLQEMLPTFLPTKPLQRPLETPLNSNALTIRLLLDLMPVMYLCRIPGPVWGEPLGAGQVAEPIHIPRRTQLCHPAARPLRQLPVQGHRHQRSGPESAQPALATVSVQRSWWGAPHTLSKCSSYTVTSRNLFSTLLIILLTEGLTSGHDYLPPSCKKRFDLWLEVLELFSLEDSNDLGAKLLS